MQFKYFVVAMVLHLAFCQDDDFTHSVMLDPDENYALSWKYDDETITFRAEVKTNGYIGFGLSRNGGMKNSDVVIGWVKDGIAHFKDRHTGNSYVAPMVDKKQDWTLVSGSENSTHTILTFTRKLDTCDKEDLKIGEGTARIIYSWHDKDPVSESELMHHTHRGSRSLLLLAAAPKRSQHPKDTSTFDILNPKVSVPSHKTTYWCQAMKLPPLKKKMHIIKYEAVVQPGHEGLVHHILVYGCRSRNIDDKFHGWGGVCGNPNMPRDIRICFNVYLSWAIGAEAIEMPDHVGIPVGTEDSPTWVVMETHYDNPQGKSDFVDNSGIRVHVTSSLRQYDAGIVQVGAAVTRDQIIPPYMPEFLSTGNCLGQCTKEVIGQKSGIKVFGSMLHGHLLARGIRTRLIRDNVEIARLGEDDHYDFNFQAIRLLKKEITVLPGDTLITECVYNSTGRTKITYGGLSTRQEMCMNFIAYYPRVDLTQCGSQLQYKIPPKYSSLSTQAWGYFLQLKGAHGFRKAFEQIAHNSPVKSSCQGLRRNYPSHAKTFPVPKIAKSLVKDKKACLDNGNLVG